MNYKINKYPDETSYAEILTFDKEFTFKINSYEDLWHLKQITDAYKHNKIKPIITIPCLLDAQADDRFAENQSFGLKLICDFLNTVEADFKIFHPHNSSIVKALINNIEIIDNTEFIKEVLSNIYCEQNNIVKNPGLYYHQKINNLVLLSPDAGAYKWITKLADNLEFTKEVISASKSRKWEDGHSKLTQILDKQNFGGKDVLVLDDLLIGGGSMKGLSKLLKTKNVGKLYCAVSHITVQNLGEDSVTNYFDKVFTTNSKFDEYYELCGPGILEIINNNKLNIIKLF